jgi:uncharacterized protein YcfJ
MRRTFIAMGLTVLIATPSLASASDYCGQRAHDRRVAGTVIGGVGGALIGQAISHNTAGTLLGGAGGAVVGNQISRTSCDRPPAYRSSTRSSSRAAEPRREAAEASTGGCRTENRPYYDERGQLIYQPTQVCK